MRRMVFGIAAIILCGIIAGCGGAEEVEQGTIAAEITCNAQDSLLTTVYMADGEAAGSSQWCACGGTPCSVEFTGLGLGNYVLGISEPDSVYRRTQGAEGLAQSLGFYADGGLSQVADTIALSEEQPSADVMIDVESGPYPSPDDADTLGGGTGESGAAADGAGADTVGDTGGI